MHTKTRTRLSRLEPLEQRLTLSGVRPLVFNPPPPPDVTVVAPITPGDAPILLPPGLATPPGTTVLPSPPPGALPPGLPPLAGAAEELAVNGLVSFNTAHPAAQINVRSFTRPNGGFILAIGEIDGDSYAMYVVNEAPTGSIVVSFGEVDMATGISESLLASQQNQFMGNMLIMQTQGDTLQSLTMVTQVGANLNSVLWSPPVIATVRPNLG
jgi:hypothetical protein